MSDLIGQKSHDFLVETKKPLEAPYYLHTAKVTCNGTTKNISQICNQVVNWDSLVRLKPFSLVNIRLLCVDVSKMFGSGH